MDKGLIIQTRPGVGDLCIFLPYIQQIQKHNTDLNFTLITKKRSSAKQILECEIPFIKTIYLEDKILKITNSKFLNFFILLKFIKKNNYSKIYIMHFSFFWFLVAKIANVKKIYTYGIFKKNVNIYKNALKNNQKWLNKKNLSTQTKIAYPKNKYKKNKNQIIVGIGSSGPTRKWSTENYISLIKKINNKNIKFYLAGGNNKVENQIANEIINKLKENKIISLSSLNIKKIMQIIYSSKLYVGNDTGFMHLSAGLNIPAIGLFGDTPLEAYGKYTRNIFPIIPVGYKTITHNSNAINEITVDQVFNEVRKFI
jgi:heptosyltransferase-2